MSEERPEVELSRSEYRQAFNRPLASPKYLWLSLAVSLAVAVGIATAALWQPQAWWLVFGIIPVSMYAGAALAGLWPNWFFGSNPDKDDFT